MNSFSRACGLLGRSSSSAATALFVLLGIKDAEVPKPNCGESMALEMPFVITFEFSCGVLVTPIVLLPLRVEFEL